MNDTSKDIVTIDGIELPLDVIAGYMDDEIREQLHSDMAPCEAQAFLDAYCVAHAAKFGEEFEVN